MNAVGSKLNFFLLSAVLTLLLSAGKAQNLVPNPGFEEYAVCPGNFSEALDVFQVSTWRAATLGTPDHFHACSVGEADVPYNWAGVSDAYEGDGYTGIYLWMDNENQYREYLQCKLLQPLLKDSLYFIVFHYKLSSYSRYAVDRIGLLLSDSLIKARHDDVLKITPTLSVIQDSALTKATGLWETASMEYKAAGGETFLTIGNFFDNDETGYYKIMFRPASERMLENSAYYYIDDVRLIPRYLNEGRIVSRELPEFSLSGAAPNTTYVLKNIQFEFGSYKLTPSSFAELDQVAMYLSEHPSIKARIFGHTDDLGSDRYNLKLSINRASTSADYLKSLGISGKRIEVFGYGKTKPLVEGLTDSARKMNRRVEIRFVD